ncbi:MAG TPA: alpha/beta hydrolase fold domain-containing protein [Tepidiformaceae bacterium]|nr:alpha/beta hydrolase fold domain-containing protein [Tepidiformaceae bacterium]
MPLDPQLKAILDAMAGLGLPPLHTQTPESARASALARRPAVEPVPVEGGVEDRTIPGPGGDLPIRIYRPGGPGPHPVLVYFHGGGWVIGDLDQNDNLLRTMTNLSGCVIVSVDYRLAPEAKFPGPAEDSYAATAWVAANAAALDVDASRLAVGGESAGGNLAAAVTLMARDRGGPPIRFQWLMYPVTDSNVDTASYHENAQGYLLERAGMIWFWDHYVRSDADRIHPYAAPLRADDLSGLPPALVITAEFDPLRDEGAAYAEALKAAGVPVDYSCAPGQTHAYFTMFAMVDAGRAALEEVSAKMKAALAP